VPGWIVVALIPRHLVAPTDRLLVRLGNAGDARRANARRLIIIGRHREEAVGVRLLVDAGDVVIERCVRIRLAEQVVVEIFRGVAIARTVEAIPQADDGRPHRRGQAGTTDAEPAWHWLPRRERRTRAVGAGTAGAELSVGGELIGIGRHVWRAATREARWQRGAALIIQAGWRMGVERVVHSRPMLPAGASPH